MLPNPILHLTAMSKVWQHCQTLLHTIRETVFNKNTAFGNIAKSGKEGKYEQTIISHLCSDERQRLRAVEETKRSRQSICQCWLLSVKSSKVISAHGGDALYEINSKNDWICFLQDEINDWQNRQERRSPTISKPNDNQQIRMERIQVSHGRTIRVVSVFSEGGHCSPEDKLKALIDLEIQKEKLCA